MLDASVAHDELCWRSHSWLMILPRVKSDVLMLVLSLKRDALIGPPALWPCCAGVVAVAEALMGLLLLVLGVRALLMRSEPAKSIRLMRLVTS